MPPLPPQEAAQLLADLQHEGFGSRQLAGMLDVAETTARHWLTGRRDMPQEVAEILVLIMRWRRAAAARRTASTGRPTAGTGTD